MRTLALIVLLIATNAFAEFASEFPWPSAEELVEARGGDASVRIQHTRNFVAIRWQDHTDPKTLDRIVNLLMPRWKEARPELIRLHRKMLDLGSNMKFRKGDTVAQLGYHRTRFTVVWPGTPAERNTLIFENVRKTSTSFDE